MQIYTQTRAKRSRVANNSEGNPIDAIVSYIQMYLSIEDNHLYDIDNWANDAYLVNDKIDHQKRIEEKQHEKMKI